MVLDSDCAREWVAAARVSNGSAPSDGPKTCMLSSLRSYWKSKSRDAILRDVHKEALTYLEPRALAELYDMVAALETRRLPGILIEAGCALGGSAIVIAAAKARTRPLRVYDVFGMIPPPSACDGQDVHERYARIRAGESEGIRGHRYYGYEDDPYETVKRNFTRLGRPIDAHNVQLISGLFQETLRPSEPVALAHIDSDWYESVRTCLERIAPHLVQGAVLVIDDYDAWSGCRRAVDEYFADKQGSFTFRRGARLHVVKN
jgi:Macrocin-O-methyltransferase (TylF)